MARMRDQNRDGERLGAIFLLGLILFNPLLVQIFDGGAGVALFGVPLLYLYLFVGWAVLIGLMAVVTERTSAHTGKTREARSTNPEDHLADR
jgi:polyferredoxin